MSNCEQCEHNALRGCIPCDKFLDQVSTDQGIKSHILLCPEFEASKVFDYAARDQVGGVL